MNTAEDRIKVALDYIEFLKEWIREQGEQSNTCTYNVLGEICKGCACKRKPKGEAA